MGVLQNANYFKITDGGSFGNVGAFFSVGLGSGSRGGIFRLSSGNRMFFPVVGGSGVLGFKMMMNST